MVITFVPFRNAAQPNLCELNEATIEPTLRHCLGSAHTTSVTTLSRANEARLAHSAQAAERRRLSFFAFVRQLSELMEDASDFDAECLPPTFRARTAMFDLLAGVAGRMEIPDGALYPDGEGGLRVEWRSGAVGELENYAVLSVHSVDEQQDYVYEQTGSRRGVLRTQPTAAVLASRISQALPTVRKTLA